MVKKNPVTNRDMKIIRPLLMAVSDTFSFSTLVKGVPGSGAGLGAGLGAGEGAGEGGGEGAGVGVDGLGEGGLGLGVGG